MSKQNNELKPLDLQDLLLDDSNDVLSDYLRVSISNDGQGAKVTVSTTDEQPVVYTSVFYGSTATDLAEMLAGCENLQGDSTE